MHVSGADGPDQEFIALAPKREYNEHAAPFLRSSDRAQAPFPLRVGRVRENGQRTRKKAFDSGDGKPMFLALGSVAPVPVEAVRLQDHNSTNDMQLYRQLSIADFTGMGKLGAPYPKRPFVRYFY